MLSNKKVLKKKYLPN